MHPAGETVNKQTSTLWARFRFMPPLQRAALVFAVFAFTTGFLDLLGWALDIEVFRSFMPGRQPMSWITASCFILSSLQVAFMLFYDKETEAYFAMKIPAILAGAAGILVFIVYIAELGTGSRLHFPSMPVIDFLWHGVSGMNFFTALLFIVFSFMLLLAASGGAARIDISHGLGIPAFLSGYFVVVSYVLGVESVHEFLGVRIALNTGLCFCALGMAVFLARPETWLMRVFTGRNFGSVMTRRMLPGIMLLPVIIGWFRLLGERTGFFASETGVVLVVMAYTLCFLALFWLNARFMNLADEERRAAEEAHIKSEAMLSRAQRSAHLGSWDLDLVNNRLTWSDEVYRIFGLKPQEFGATYEAFLEYVHPEDRAKVNEAYTSSLREGRDTYEVEHRVVQKATGAVRVVHEKCEHFRGENGGIIRSTGMVHDITERVLAEEKIRAVNEELTSMNEELASMNEELNASLEVQAMAETALKSSLQRFELLAKTSGTLLRTGDPENAINELCRDIMQKLGCHVFFNYLADSDSGRLRLNAYSGIAGDEAERIKYLDYGSAVCGCVARDCAAIVVGNVQGAEDPRTALIKTYGVRAYACHPIVGREGKAAGTLSFGTRDRDSFSAEDTALMKTVTDEVSAALIRMKDGIELKKSHGALEERVKERTAQLAVERKRLFDVMETLPVYVILLTKDHCLDYSNRFFRERFGEAKGGRCHQAMFGSPGPCETCTIHRDLEGKKSHNWQWLAKDGREYDVYDFAFAEADGSEKILEMGIDITDIKKAQKALLDAQAQVDRAKRLSDIGTLASTVAHELRNPLATIGVAVYNLKKKVKGKNVQGHIDNILKKVKESDQIINNLLFYSRIKPPVIEETVIYGLLKETCGDMTARGKKGVKISMDIGPLKGTIVEVDPVQLREVFFNLLNNSMEAVPAGKGVIKVAGGIDGGNVKVIITDNGTGIDSSELEKVFNPFFTTKAKGTGLGLSVCRQIMNNHNGSIWLESVRGAGTTAHVLLPKTGETHGREK